MLCPDCGKELPENVLFCGSCGYKLTQKITPPANTQTPAEPAPAEQPKKQKPRKTTAITILAIVTALAVLVGCLFGGFFLFAKNETDNSAPIAYMTDDTLMILPNAHSKAKPVEVMRLPSDASAFTDVSLSSDGTRLVFRTQRNNSSHGIGKLYCVDYQLLLDNKKSRKAIETIDDNVREHALIGTDVVYVTTDNALYVFNGEQSDKIADNVTELSEYNDERFLYYADRCYYIATSYNPKNPMLLGSTYPCSVNGDDDIFVFRNAQEAPNHKQGVYRVGFHHEDELLFECVEPPILINNVFYFVNQSGVLTELYECFSDNKRELDALLTTKPLTKSMFTTPGYEFVPITDYNADETALDELYTSCTKPLSLLSLGKLGISMQDALLQSDRTPSSKAAIQSFIDTYGQTADKDGFIKVTPEVKEALKAINNTYWAELCGKRVYCKTGRYFGLEWFSYSEAQRAYDSAESRNDMRKILQHPDASIPLYTVSSYQNGKTETICENVFYYDIDERCLSFCSVDMFTGTRSLTEHSLIEKKDASSFFKVGEIPYIAVLNPNNGAVYKDNGIPFSWRRFFVSNSTYAVGDELLVHESSFSKLLLEGNTFSDAEELQDANRALAVFHDTAYYAHTKNGESDDKSPGIYSYRNGTSTLLMPDSPSALLWFYEDDWLVSSRSFPNNSTIVDDIYIFNAVKDTVFIAEEVSQFKRGQNGDIMYCADDTLYCYNGDTAEAIAEDVDNFWPLNTMEECGFRSLLSTDTDISV